MISLICVAGSVTLALDYAGNNAKGRALVLAVEFLKCMVFEVVASIFRCVS